MAQTAIPPDDVARVVMLTFGNMERGGMYWAYLAIKPSRYEEFKKISATKQYNIQNFVKDAFGEVIVSGEGGLPPRDVTKQVAKLFGIPYNQLFSDADPMPIIAKGIEKLQEKKSSS
jgi:hypothetical protein